DLVQQQRRVPGFLILRDGFAEHLARHVDIAHLFNGERGSRWWLWGDRGRGWGERRVRRLRDLRLYGEGQHGYRCQKWSGSPENGHDRGIHVHAPSDFYSIIPNRSGKVVAACARRIARC